VKQFTSAPKRILIRGTNWVGDAVMSIPAMREIRRLFPDARISLLVRPWVKEIYSAAPFVDEIIEYDKSGTHRGWTGFRRLIHDLRERRFDAAFLLQNAFEAAFIAWCARIPARIGYARNGRSLFLTHACDIDPEVHKVHQAYYYLGIISGIGLLAARSWKENGTPLSIEIGIREPDRISAAAMLKANGVREGETIVGMNSGAYYGEAKRWFPERYAAVGDWIAEEYGARILLFGAQSDLRTTQEVASRMKHPAIILAGRTTLGELMGLIGRCDLFITNDSGPMHLAAALNVPQLAIFGSTSEVATGPLSPNAVVIKYPVPCNPCFLRKCPTDFRCMTGITVERVIAAAREKLGRPVKPNYELQRTDDEL
jgi:heptosyltransferase-2